MPDKRAKPTEVVSLNEEQVRRFLRALASVPFITVTFDENHLTLYTKGVDEAQAARILKLLTTSNEE